MHWCIGALVHWCSSVVVHWCIGAVVHWCIGAVVQWRSGAVVCRLQLQTIDKENPGMYPAARSNFGNVFSL